MYWTSNIDRAIINAVRAPLYAISSSTIALRWRRILKNDTPLVLQEFLYDESIRPKLLGYFIFGAPGLILDNGNGNVLFGVANGTSCSFVAVAWNNEYTRASADILVHNYGCHGGICDLPIQPDHIIVSINTADVSEWPLHLNLAPRMSNGLPIAVHIPVGFMHLKHKSVRIRMPRMLVLLTACMGWT